MPPRPTSARQTSPAPAPHRERSGQAASAARIRRSAPPWLLLETSRGLDEDVAYRQRMRQITGGLPFLDAGAGGLGRAGAAELTDPALGPLNDWLTERAAQVTATPAELASAQERAQAVIDALAEIYPGAEVYRTGSIAHGDALSPLNDVDLGVILTNRTDLGPGIGGPAAEMEKAADELTKRLRPRFPELTADPGNKRSIVLEFNDPATPGAADFTCDVILAIPSPAGNLLIPNTELAEGWDENDPRGHVERLKQAQEKSQGSFGQTVRLVKHWRDGQGASQGGKPLYSWNIKTLALEAGDGPSQPFEGLYRFFAHAIGSVAQGPTENPGSLNFPPPAVPIERLQVTGQLQDALQTLDRARMFALDGRAEAGLAELKKLFPEGS